MENKRTNADYCIIRKHMREKRPEVSKDLPNRLKELRKVKGWSQGQLAIKVDADQKRISKYERGVIFPTVDMVLKLSTALNVSVDYLLTGEQEVKLEHIQNQKLLKRLEKISKLSEKEQEALIMVMDAFITKQGVFELANS